MALQTALAQMEAMLRAIAGESPCSKLVTPILCGRGKRLRPRLIWACGGFGSRGDPVPLMAGAELIHTASLIHDDVIDGAAARRGVPTIHTVRDTRTALQCGDYLLARAAQLLSNSPEIDAVFSAASLQMCRGEFRQLSQSVQTVSGYARQICCKTAALLRACCLAGAMASGADPAVCRRLARFGFTLGAAFQLRDDILDLSPDGFDGKPGGQDLQNGILTLPALLVLTPGELSQTPEQLRRMILARGGDARAREILTALCSKAFALLDPLPDCPERQLLQGAASRLIL